MFVVQNNVYLCIHDFCFKRIEMPMCGVSRMELGSHPSLSCVSIEQLLLSSGLRTRRSLLLVVGQESYPSAILTRRTTGTFEIIS